VRVIATHLGLRPDERRWQVRRLLSLFETGTADYSVLLGDLNEWLLWGRPLRWLRRQFAPTPHLPTFPARLPLFALDRIWVRPRAALHRLVVHVSAAARLASDHLPLRAELIRARDPAPCGSSVEAPHGQPEKDLSLPALPPSRVFQEHAARELRCGCGHFARALPAQCAAAPRWDR
jgi:hypothetical protein